MDAVSGATYSSTGILNAVKLALAKAAIAPAEEAAPEQAASEEVVEEAAPSEAAEPGGNAGHRAHRGGGAAGGKERCFRVVQGSVAAAFSRQKHRTILKPEPASSAEVPPEETEPETEGAAE